LPFKISFDPDPNHVVFLIRGLSFWCSDDEYHFSGGKDERSHFAGLVDRELLDFVRRLFAQLVSNRLGLAPSQFMSFNTGGHRPAGIFLKIRKKRDA
jgi:hypothetical protein